MRFRLAFAVIAVASAGFGGCREHRSPPAEAVALNEADAAIAPRSGPAPVDAAAKKQAPFVPREAPEPWATWRMPNTPLPGLPNPQKYDTQKLEVVVDEVTGLMWQRNVVNEFLTFDEAQRRCERLALGGYDDWRLPSRIELVSILDMAQTQPSINRAAFPQTPTDWFWTSTVSAGSDSEAWYVYFYSGYPKTNDTGNRFSVRCVRNARPRVRPATRYDVQRDTVRDLATELTWERAVPDKTFTLDAARSYCKGLTLGAKKGWRLPTEVELFTLIDEHAASPMIDSEAFPNTPGEQFWSSSFFANGPAMAWYVFFNRGDGLYGMPSEKYRVRCVV